MIQNIFGMKETYKIDFETMHLLEDLFKDKVVILDVRGPQEYAHGYIRNAINVPVDNINNYKKFKKDTLYITYCGSGGRAMRARDDLAAKGYSALSAGGIKNYKGKIVK